MSKYLGTLALFQTFGHDILNIVYLLIGGFVICMERCLAGYNSQWQRMGIHVSGILYLKRTFSSFEQDGHVNIIL